MVAHCVCSGRCLRAFLSQFNRVQPSVGYCRCCCLQAGADVVSMDAIRAALVHLKLASFDDKLVECLLDKGFEDDVLVSALVPALREVGLRGTQALEVKKLVLLPAAQASPVMV